MSAPGGSIPYRIYTWIVSSLLRMAVTVGLLSALLVLMTMATSPLAAGITAGLIMLGLGVAAHRSRRSQATIDYPGIDHFFQAVPCYLSIQDSDLCIRRTNKFFRLDFGDRVGEKCYRVYKGLEEICPNCPVVRTFADGQMHTKEETVLTKDGKPAHMIVYTTPVKDERGKITGVMEMSTNITEVKRLQAEIDASRREYQDLFERVPCYISIQGPDFRIMRSNAQFKRDFGDHVGRYCYEVFKGRTTVCPDCHIRKTLEDGRIHFNETSVMRTDGTTANLIVYSSPIYDENGELRAVMEMSTDITEVKKLQAELIYMGKTIAVMAHRVKNILMGLEGGIYVVSTGMEEKDDALLQQGWSMVQRNVESVSRIVKDLLYSAKEREMNFELIDPAPVIRSVYELFEGRARQDGIALAIEMSSTLPRGRFDSEALHSLMTNLVTNAFQACVNDDSGKKDRHRIVIRARCDVNGKYVFEVEDNGQGIPGHLGESLFQDFFSTKGREGTGLGLLVAQRVSEQHGGGITFESKEGEGTVFRAVIPPHDKAAPQQGGDGAGETA